MNDHSSKDIAVEFLTLVASGRVSEAYERHVGAEFRHHNPYFIGDATSLKEAMQTNAVENPNKVLNIQRALQDGNEVAVFSHIRQHPEDMGSAVVHIFRYERGRIVEIWDIGQDVPENSINENSMF